MSQVIHKVIRNLKYFFYSFFLTLIFGVSLFSQLVYTPYSGVLDYQPSFLDRVKSTAKALWYLRYIHNDLPDNIPIRIRFSDYYDTLIVGLKTGANQQVSYINGGSYNYMYYIAFSPRLCQVEYPVPQGTGSNNLVYYWDGSRYRNWWAVVLGAQEKSVPDYCGTCDIYAGNSCTQWTGLMFVGSGNACRTGLYSTCGSYSIYYYGSNPNDINSAVAENDFVEIKLPTEDFNSYYPSLSELQEFITNETDENKLPTYTNLYNSVKSYFDEGQVIYASGVDVISVSSQDAVNISTNDVNNDVNTSQIFVDVDLSGVEQRMDVSNQYLNDISTNVEMISQVLTSTLPVYIDTDTIDISTISHSVEIVSNVFTSMGQHVADFFTPDETDSWDFCFNFGTMSFINHSLDLGRWCPDDWGIRWVFDLLVKLLRFLAYVSAFYIIYDGVLRS